MTTRWVQVCSTSASRWLETITVRPAAAYRISTSRISRICGGSRPLVGSSRISRSGQAEHGLGDGEALAHALRVGAHRPVERVAEARRSPAPPPGARPRRGGRSPASTAPGWPRPDRCGRKPAPSTNAPTRDSTGAPGRMACPKTRISPSSGLIRPISMRRVVVLPAPFGPSRPRTWPLAHAEGQVPYRVTVRRPGVPLAQVR